MRLRKLRNNRKEARQMVCRLSELMAAGMPVGEALSAGVLCGGTAAPLMKRAATAVEKGRSLSTALERVSGSFTAAEIAIVRAGERAGDTGEAITILARQLEAEHADRRRIVSALAYPCFLALAMTTVMVLISVVVLPTLAELYSATGTELPAATHLLIVAGQTATLYGPAGLVALASVTAIGAVLSKTLPAVRYQFDRLFLSLPLLGNLLQAAHKQRLYSLLSSLISSGCDVPESLQLAAEAIGNRCLRARVVRLRSFVVRGMALSEALSRAGIDPLGHEAGFLRQAEAVGDYPATLSRMSSICAQQRNETVSRFAAIAEPTAVIVMAVAVGLGAVALYQPILNSASILGGF